MVKIVNGQIITEEGEAPKTPFAQLRTDRPRRSSIQDLQIAEQMKERLEKAAQEAQSTAEHPPPTWKDVINEKVSVFGTALAVKHLVLLALASIVIYGVQGLLICLLAVYLGTLYKPKSVQDTFTSHQPEIKEERMSTEDNNASNYKLTTATGSPIVIKRRFSTLSDLSVPTSA